jgi:Protein of unknown function with PCYCGC motif
LAGAEKFDPLIVKKRTAGKGLGGTIARPRREGNMASKRIALWGGLSVLVLAPTLIALPQRAASRMAPAAGAPALADPAQAENNEPVPAYHTEIPKGPLPATLSPSLFTDPVVQNGYALARKVRRVLYQQPCYCHCDRSQGHGSLLDCFAGKHAAECGVCVREGLYSYEQSSKGKTPAQIREGIERGDWRALDVSKYQTPVVAK